MLSIQAQIESRLKLSLVPVKMSVINESGQHNVPPNSESHFKVIVTSAAFQGLSLVKRHQHVYALLSDLLSGPVHALSLHLYTPEEWVTKDVPLSPVCHGGKN